MTKCAICTGGSEREAAMFCAQCNTGICERHTVDARFCSEECARKFEKDRDVKGRTDHSGAIARRSQYGMMILVAGLLVLIIAAYFALTALGVF